MKDSENNYINTNKIPGYNELVENMVSVVRLTQAQYDAIVQSGTISNTTLYIITDA